MIRKLVFKSSGPSLSLFHGVLRESRYELRLLIFFFFVLFIGLGFQPALISSLKVGDLAVISAFREYNLTPSALKSAERFNLKEIVSKNMSYSYEKTELGFYLRDLNFFELNSKADVEKRILESLPPSLRRKAYKYVRAVLILAEKHQVDPIWVLSVMWTESHFDYSAQSWAGARGLMQIMPETRKFVYRQYKARGKRLMVEEPSFNVNKYFPYPVEAAVKTNHVRKLVNIELGIIYLKTLLKTFKDHKYATVAYNMGPGWTQKRLRLNLPVGEKNEYLDKVDSAYKRITRKI